MPRKNIEPLDQAIKDLKDSPPKPRGVPKGYIQSKTIQKEEAKAAMREMIIAELRPIVRAGIRAATGVDHFMLRNEDTGEFRRLTDPTEIEAALNHPGAKEGSTFWIHSKDPNIPALVTLLDRAIGKPTEEIQAEVKGGLVIRWKDKED